MHGHGGTGSPPSRCYRTDDDYATLLEGSMRVCETPECGKKHKARGLCNACYKRWRKQQRVKGTCTIKDCGKPAVHRGLCDACYSWWQRHGKTPTIAKRNNGPAQCGTVSGYKKHLRLGETTCEDCREASRDYNRALKAEDEWLPQRENVSWDEWSFG